jgi:integrase
LAELTEEQIQHMVIQYLKKTFNMLDERWLVDDDDYFPPRDYTEGYLSTLEFVEDDRIASLNACDYSDIENSAVDLLKKNGIFDLNKNSYHFKKLCRELLKSEIKMIKVEKRQIQGDFSDNLNTILGTARNPAVSEFTKNSAILLEALIDEYKKRQMQSKKWSDNTLRNHQTKINAMLQVIGNRPVNEITVTDIRRLAKLLELLPPGFARIKEYKDISKIKPEDLEGKHDKTLDVSTRRDYLNFVKSVFTFAEENEYISKNPVVTGIIPPKKKNTRDKRLTFDDPSDLENIFSPDLFLYWSKDHPSRFWIPLLALYTGCRLEEMASLYCEDVFEHKGIWCIDINDNHDRKVKNHNAIRSVPLHPILVKDLKFPQYVATVETDGHQRVFPELYVANFKYGHEFSKRFGYYLKNKVGINDKKKTFHSFRHTVSDHLYKKLVMESLVEELTGRAGKTETRKTYTKGYRVDTLYEECILKLEYQVDLTHLKKSRFVPR